MKRAAISCLLIIMCAVKQSSGKPIEYSAWKKCKSVYMTIDLNFVRILLASVRGGHR